MTAPTPNAALMRRAESEIRRQIINFNWSNYGLDLVESVEYFDWADELTNRICARVAEIFGPRPDGGEGGSLKDEQPYGTGCRCDWLGVGTPEHAPSPLCRSLRPDADRDEMQPPPCADHQSSELNCAVCTAQRRAFYNALGRVMAEALTLPPADGEVAEIVDHGPVKPPYGTAERADWESDHQFDYLDHDHDVPPNAGSVG